MHNLSIHSENNMSELQLFPGPRLESKSWVQGDDKSSGEWITTDVTDRAFEYLFHELVVDPEVTLADVFRLVTDVPIMQAVFRQEFVEEICAEVSKGPVAKVEEAWQKIEFLELIKSGSTTPPQVPMTRWVIIGCMA